MSDKFKYAPGMPGFGTKGSDGSIGAQGIAMYFTDLDPTTDINTINSKLKKNQVLWSTSSALLPDNRVYVTGDLFLGEDGKAYEINAETNTFTYKFANLNMGGLFVPLGLSSALGYQRYFNSNNSPKYIVDNIYTVSGAIDYSQSPVTIYGIEPIDFARIEYSNVPVGLYNPFTVYSSGQTVSDDALSMAIVRDISINTFRIGNLDDAGNLRNVNLTFDVSSLVQAKDSGNSFSVNTPTGTILTNYEIAANSLFDPNFNSNPSSFTASFNTLTKEVSINWILNDFTNDPATKGTLYFLTDKNPYDGQAFRFDSSALRPLIFEDVDSAGGIKITGLSSTDEYRCYMKLTKNGWSRNSDEKSLFGTSISVTPLFYGAESSTAHGVTFTVTSNTPWNVSFTLNPSTFMSYSSCSSIGGLSGTFDVSIADSLDIHSRTGNIRVANTIGGTYQDVSITQNRGQVGPELYLTATSPSNAFSSSSWPNYGIDASIDGTVKGSATVTIDVSSNRDWTIYAVPAGMTILPSSGIAGVVTPVTLTISANNTLIPRSGSFVFDNGSFTYLNITQDAIHQWLEYYDSVHGITRVGDGSPVNINYNLASGKWSVNGNLPSLSNPNLNFTMKFTGGAPITWAWDNTTFPWLSMTDRSGVGNGYGPTFSYISGTPSGYNTIAGNIGGQYGYPHFIIVSGT